MTAQDFRNLFPYLKDGKGVVYFDNAATSQRPASVIDYTAQAMTWHNANTHRAVHRLSAEATDAYEASREEVRKFLNAPSAAECIFTSGTTAAINLVAHSFCERFIHEGDEIITGEAEHHSNFVPWQLAAERCGAQLVYWRMEEDGSYSLSELKRLLNEKTRLVCVGHASNVLGNENPIKETVEMCHENGTACLVDGAQGAVHCKVDVQDLDCDFYAFSAHKMFGPTGVGVLYGKQKWLEQMPPFLAGGEMVGTVSMGYTSFAPLPLKFEAGTPNFINVAGVKPALELLQKALADTKLNAELEKNASTLRDGLLSINGLRLYGADAVATGSHADFAIRTEHAGVTGTTTTRHLPVFSFTIDGVHHEDLATLLDKMNVAVRSGQMCAEPLMRHFGVTGMTRASLLWYNTAEEVQIFLESLDKAIKLLK